MVLLCHAAAGLRLRRPVTEADVMMAMLRCAAAGLCLHFLRHTLYYTPVRPGPQVSWY